MRAILLVLLLDTVMITATSATQTGRIEVHVTARNDDGQVFVNLYDRAEGFPGNADKALRTERSKQVHGQAKVVFEDLPYGEYAVSAYHDEDGNGKMKTVYGTIPLEGVGVSRDAKGVMGPPKFEDAKFELDDNLVTVDVRINY